MGSFPGTFSKTVWPTKHTTPFPQQARHPLRSRAQRLPSLFPRLRAARSCQAPRRGGSASVSRGGRLATGRVPTWDLGPGPGDLGTWDLVLA